MCQFLSLDFEYAVKSRSIKDSHTVRLQAYPQLRGHSLDVVECDGISRVEQFTCGKVCRGLLDRRVLARNLFGVGDFRALIISAVEMNGRPKCGLDGSKSHNAPNVTISRGRGGCDDPTASAGKEKFPKCRNAPRDGERVG